MVMPLLVNVCRTYIFDCDPNYELRKHLLLIYLGQHSKAESDHETWAGIFHSLYA